MKIGGLQKVSLLDFPDRIAAIVFVKGCNFRCPFCFNRDLVFNNLPTISQRTVLSFLARRQKILDGVVITGGEPLLQLDLADFIRKIRRLDFAIKLDTNGSQPKSLETLLKRKFLDYVALDIKAPLDTRYAKAVGLSKYHPQPVINSVNLLLESKIPFEFRTTVVPGLHNQTSLQVMAQQLKRFVKRRQIPWLWQNFQPKSCLDQKFEKIKPYSSAKLEKLLVATHSLYSSVALRQI